ncbi:hypothetical protein D3C73_1622350 [compost metagenome]
MNSFTSDELLHLAIIKLVKEGGDWRAVAQKFPRLCFEISIALQEEKEPTHDQ